MRDLRHEWQKWTRTERFSVVIIFAAMVMVIIPAAVEFAQQTSAPTIAHYRVLPLAR